jgi:hypothetical protein
MAKTDIAIWNLAADHKNKGVSNMRQGSKVIYLALLFGWLAIGNLRADTGVERVGIELNNMHQWLGNNENASHWKQHLRSDELVAQLQKGPGADRKTVADILSRYSENTPGLDKVRFREVRVAIEAWLSELPVSITDLRETVLAEKDHFRPVAAGNVATAKKRLATALRNLEGFLAGGSPANTESWKQYLRWNDLQAELNNEAGANPAELQGIADLYFSNHRGLETRAFSDVRRAINDYAYAVYYAGDPIKGLYGQQIDELAKRLDSYSKNPNSDDAAVIGRTLGWFERGGQVPHLVSSVRRNFSRPNCYVIASQRLIAAGVESNDAREKLNQPQYVRDYILKMNIHGTAYPNLMMDLVFVPNSERATFDLRLYGGASSNTVGYRGPVTVYTTGYTSINAAKRVYFDASGLTANGAYAQCATSTNINDIAANCGLIERFAWSQAGKTKGQAEGIASARAQSRIAGQVNGEVEPRLAEANESYSEGFRNRLLRRDGFPRVFQASTTDNEMSVTMLHASGGQIAASTPPPDLSVSHDLSARVHESLVLNFGESLLGGVTLTDERIVELLTEAKAEIPEELQITQDKDPWSITFTRDQPVAATFANNEVRIAVRGRRFTGGDRVVRELMEISASYKLEKSNGGSKLTRQGDVVAEYVNKERQSFAETAMKTLMRKKFEALFKPEIVSDGLLLPQQFRNVGKLQLQQLQADKGWLTLGWEKPGAPAVALAVAENQDVSKE